MNKSKAIAQNIIAEIGVNGTDVNRVLSYGRGGGKNMLDEMASKNNISFTVKNPTAIPAIFVIGGWGGIDEIFEQDTKELFGFTHVLQDITPADPKTEISVIGGNPARSLERVQRSFTLEPTRIREVHFNSVRLDGSPDQTNYAGELKTLWNSPYENATENSLPLSKFLSPSSSSPQFAKIDFTAEQFPVILSHSNMLLFTVMPGTQLSVNMKVGAIHSLPQYLYRTVKASDSVIPKVFGAHGCDC